MKAKKLLARDTKILATLGPSSDDESTLAKMINAGMDAVRLNMSHGSHDEHRRRVETLRRLARKRAKDIAVVMDLQGAKIRTAGSFPSGEMELQAGHSIVLEGRALEASPQRLGVGLKKLPQLVKPGDPILIDDGKIRLRVAKTRGDEVHCEIEKGGKIRERRGVNFPETNLQQPPVTAKDVRDLKLGMDMGVDFIAQSFVGQADDVRALKRRLSRHGHSTPVISKLERPQALDNLEEILEVTDGVMVARGDLGVEIPLESVPAAQKHIITRAGNWGRLCITATQMLESMIDKPQPTRAEVSDVANAVFDGTDAVMLSGETAVGSYPVETIQFMARIICGAEAEGRRPPWKVSKPSRRLFRGALAQAAAEVSLNMEAKAMVILTMSGATALRASKHRPNIPILAVTPSIEARRRCTLFWGVMAVGHPFVRNSDRLRARVEAKLLDLELLHSGDVIVILGGSQPGDVATDFLQLRKIHG